MNLQRYDLTSPFVNKDIEDMVKVHDEKNR